MNLDRWIDEHRVPTRLAVWLGALLFVSLLGLLVHRADAAEATLNWTHPSQRVDNTPIAITEIRETQIDWAKCAAGNTFPTSVDGTKAVPAPGTQTTITGLSYGTWCFRARSVDTGGLVSDNSGTVWKQYIAPPKPPVITTVGGLVWEMRTHPVDGPYLARVAGTIVPGKACQGLAPQTGFDLFTVSAQDADLNRKPNPNSTLVAQCHIAG